MRALQRQPGEQPSAYRFLSSFSRGPDEVRLGDWLVLQGSDELSVVGRVDHMVQATYVGVGASLVRLLCTQCKTVNLDALFGMWTSPEVAPQLMLVSLELMQVRVVVHTTSGDRDVYV